MGSTLSLLADATPQPLSGDFQGRIPALRIRLGDPDELRSNQMNKTLDLLKYRALAPESGQAESLHGSVIRSKMRSV